MTVRIAQNTEDFPTPDQLRSVSGMEFMQAMLTGKVPMPTMSGILGFHLTAVEDGKVEFRGAPRFEHTNPWGGTHGGWYGALLDSTMTCAVLTRIPQGNTYTTLDFSVRMTRPIPLGLEVIAEAVVQHAGRRTAVARGEIRDDEGRLYATGATTCMVFSGD